MKRSKLLWALMICAALLVAAIGSTSAQAAKVKVTTKVDKKAGTALVTAKVSTKGKLTLKGQGIKPVKKKATKAGKVKLKVKATGKAKKQLKKKGKTKLELKLKFKPTNGGPNDPYDPYNPAGNADPYNPNDPVKKKNVKLTLKKKVKHHEHHHGHGHK